MHLPEEVPGAKKTVLDPNLLAPKSVWGELESHITDLEAYINGTVMGPYAARLNSGEGVSSEPKIRSNGQFAEAVEGFITSTTGLFLSQPTPSDEEGTVVSLVDELFDSRTLKFDFGFLPVRILAAVEKIRYLRGYSESIIPALQGLNLHDRFILMKRLAERPLGKQLSVSQNGVRALQLVYVFSTLDSESPQPESIAESIGRGEFNGLIAKELLHQCWEENALEDKRSFEELNKLIRIGHIFDPHAPIETIITKLTTPAVIEMWPGYLRQVLDATVKQYGRSLNANWTECKNFLDKHNCLIQANTEEDVREASMSLIYEVAQRMSTNTALSVSQRLAARSVVAEHKRRRALQDQPKTSQSSVEITLDERLTEQKDRAIYCVNKNGEFAPEDSDGFKDFFAKYINDHKDQVGLERHLESIINYLKTADFGKGLPRGVKKLRDSGNFTRGDKVLGPIYQLAPNAAVGLPNLSSRGEKIRVWFVIENGSIGILAINEKPQIAKTRRSLNIQGRTRTK